MEISKDRRTAELALMQAGFAMQETALFLDTHPECKEALEAFYTMQDAYADLAVAFIERFGPLEAGDDGNDKKWAWVNTPWPWQLEG